jgi:hypothetical protein
MGTGREVPQPGEPFNPWRGECGFSPPEVVGRLKELTTRDGSQRRLTAAAKLLYAQICRRHGRNGRCFPGQETLAKDLAMPVRTVGFNLQVLVDCQLIEVIRRGAGEGRHGRTNEYRVLWISAFDGLESPRLIGKITTTDRQDPVGLIGKITTTDRQELVRLIGNVDSQASESIEQKSPRNSLSKSGTKIRDLSQSSSSARARPGEADGPETTTTTSSPYLEPGPGPENLEAPPWPSLKQRDAAALILAELCQSKTADPITAGEVLALLHDAGDFDAFVFDCQERRLQPRGPRYFLALAREWPLRRELVTEQYRRATAPPPRPEYESWYAETPSTPAQPPVKSTAQLCAERGWKLYEPGSRCAHCAGYGKRPDTGEECTCSAGVSLHLELTKCERCGHSGIIWDPNDNPATGLRLEIYCTCEHGADARSRGAADKYNESVHFAREFDAKRGPRQFSPAGAEACE